MTNPFGWKRKYAIYLGLLPALLMFLIFSFGPSLATGVFSFTDITGVPGAPVHFVGLTNYKEFFFLRNTRDNLNDLKRTIIFSLAVTIIQNGVGLLLALILNKKIKGHNFYKVLIFLPVILGVTVTGLSWSLIFNPADGPAAKLLGLFGGSSNFLGSYEHAFPLVIFIQIWMAMGYSLIIFLAGLQAISNDIYEAGLIDGTTSWQKFRYLTFPLLWPMVVVNVLLAIIGSLQTYQVIFVTTSGQYNTRTLGMSIYLQAFGSNITNNFASTSQSTLRQGYAAALSIILFILVLTATIISRYYMSRKGDNDYNV